MDIHFVCEKVVKGQVRVLHVSSRYQIADIFTKGLPLQLFDDFRNSLNIRQPLVSTTGAYYNIKYSLYKLLIYCILVRDN